MSVGTTELGGAIHLCSDVKLPDVIDGMAMLQVKNISLPTNFSPVTVDSNPTIPEMEATSSKRVLRKRLATPIHMDFKELGDNSSKKPEVKKARKRTYVEMQTEEEIKKYYLDKQVKKTPNTLETIFEEDSENENSINIGKRKLRRMIQFGASPSSKIKKRRAKMKLHGHPAMKKAKISMETVINKLYGKDAEMMQDELTS